MVDGEHIARKTVAAFRVFIRRITFTVDPEKKIFQILRSIYHGIHPFWKIPLIPDCSVRRTLLTPVSFHKTV